jgi:hypothetical protein
MSARRTHMVASVTRKRDSAVEHIASADDKKVDVCKGRQLEGV